ncbi:MAG: DUF2791 family P-loop domain-containing protein [Cyanobacteria bacterium REEB65]|nr:DUF2791 family P-loop domain-containing protein [Cyanobacteria bacterium REEB65]
MNPVTLTAAQANAAAPSGLPSREDRFLAEGIVRALKLGLVPQRGIDRIVVGRDREAEQLRRDLDYAMQGGSGVKFLSGDYGSGKTFMCSLVREAAWQRNMVVSVVELGRNAPLYRLDSIYRQIMAGLRTRDLPHAPAFDYLVQQWLFGLEQAIQTEHQLDPLADADRDRIAELVSQRINEHLAKVSIFDSSFANAFRGYYSAQLRGDQTTADAALGWLRGEQNIPQELKGKFHIKGGVNKDNALAFLRSMMALIGSIGYCGLVVVFDETELVRSLNRADSRQASYENIKLFCDAAGQGSLPHGYVLFTGTPELFSDPQKGIPSYQALYDRLRSRHPAVEGRTEVRGAIMPLEGFTEARMVEVAEKVRDIHALAFDWEPRHRLDRPVLEELAQRLALKLGQDARTIPRGFLKTLVDILDICQDDPTYDPRGDFAATDQTVAAVRAIEQSEAHLLDF